MHLLAGYRPDGMDRRASLGVRRDHAVGVTAEIGHARGPAQGVAVAEPQLGSGQREQAAFGQAARQVARVEQRHAQARLGCRLDQGAAHGVRIVIGASARLVVQVVELPHAAHPRQRHLGEHGAGQPVVAVRVEARRDVVHALAPGPERAAVRLSGGA